MQLRDDFMKLESGRFKAIEAQLLQYCTVKDAVLATLESHVEQMKSGLLKMEPQSTGIAAYDLKLQAVRKDLEATGRNVQAFLTK